MSKRNNISYIKPKDPSFLQKIKADIGYKEGPTVDTKRQRICDSDDDEINALELEDEKPQIVVLTQGDLTAEEAELEKRRLEIEESKKPADLNQRIIFKSKAKPVDPDTIAAKTHRLEQSTSKAPRNNNTDKKRKQRENIKESKLEFKIDSNRSQSKVGSKLSFNEDDEEEEEA